LRLAARHNRDLQTSRETLIRQAISLRGAQRDYGFAVAGTLGYVLSSGEDSNSQASSLDLSAKRPLPLGGSLSFSAASSTAHATSAVSNGTASTSSAGARLNQPLLAGAGYTASHHALIQAERNTIYALRAFARDRQAAAIEVVSGFYQLLTQKAAVENTRMNANQSTLLRQRTEALFRVQRAPAIDVMRAQQQELAASNSLAQVEASFDSQRQQFLIKIGLALDAASTLAGTVPDIQPVSISETDGLLTALAQRLDLQTARDRVADARRRLLVARSNLMPAFDAYGEAAWSASGTRTADTRDAETSYSAGVVLKLPLDKRSERDAVRTAQLDLDAAERSAQQVEDSVRLNVAGAYRQIAYLAQAARIEKRNLEIAEKRAENARFRFRNGELVNRDVVEAENELLSARNSLAQAHVQFAIQRLVLLRDIGMLDVGQDGSIVILCDAQGEKP
jgi:outer membrane protein TolC